MKDNVLAVKNLSKSGLPRNGVLKAKAEFASIGNQPPYFSITADLYEHGRDVAGGCMHDEVAEHFPEFAPYIRWHLTSLDGPMHYLANAIYHAGFCLGMENSRNLDHLKSTIVFGAVESDASVDLEKLDASSLQSFLVNRFPALMQQFRTDMNTLFDKEVVTETASEPVPYTSGKLSTPENREALRAKKRQGIIDDANSTIHKATTRRDGLLWLFDQGLDIENVIYYDHREIFTFGWREKVSDAERDRILEVISEFPFEYEIKAQDKVYSGRE